MLQRHVSSVFTPCYCRRILFNFYFKFLYCMFCSPKFFFLINKQGVVLTGSNRTGPPCFGHCSPGVARPKPRAYITPIIASGMALVVVAEIRHTYRSRRASRTPPRKCHGSYRGSGSVGSNWYHTSAGARWDQ